MTGFEIICIVFILLIVALALGVIHLLYASCYIPEQRTWQGLTDDELEMLELKHAPPVHPEFVKDDDWWEFARAIEAKLKEKNNAN